MTTGHVCKGCGAAIVWQRLNGKWHPCDPHRLTIVADDKLVSGYVSHFATCPDAPQFRKVKRSG